MSPRGILVYGFLIVCIPLLCAGFVHWFLVPVAKDCIQLETELEQMNSANLIFSNRAAGSGSTDLAAAGQSTEKSLAKEVFLNNWMRGLDPGMTGASPEDRQRWVQQVATKSGRAPEIFKSLLPADELPEQEGAFQFVTTADLVGAAAAAGIQDFGYVVFPKGGGAPPFARFGDSIAARWVRMEYDTNYSRHRDFTKTLLRRRDRGPFYTFEKLEIIPVPNDAESKPAAPSNATIQDGAVIRVRLDLLRLSAAAR